MVNYGFNTSELHKFKFLSKQNCKDFEKMLSLYSQRTLLNCQPDTRHLNLAEAYSKFIDSEKYEENNFGRIFFSWIFDIKLSYFFLELESLKTGALHNEINSHLENIDEAFTSIEIPEFFPAHMEFQKIFTSYTLRYRAIWDKIMAVLIMYYTKETKKPLKGNSKIKAFEKACLKTPEIPQDFALGVSILVRSFSDLYRTSEAHDSGVFRNWSFVTLPRSGQSPTNLLMLFQGSLNHTIMRLSRAILHDEKIPLVAHPSNMPEEEKTKYFWVLRNELKKLEK